MEIGTPTCFLLTPDAVKYLVSRGEKEGRGRHPRATGQGAERRKAGGLRCADGDRGQDPLSPPPPVPAIPPRARPAGNNLECLRL